MTDQHEKWARFLADISRHADGAPGKLEHRDHVRIGSTAAARNWLAEEIGGGWLFGPVVVDMPRTPLNAKPLTTREVEVFQALADGKDPRVELGLTAGTVKSHLHRSYAKLGVDDKAGAIFALMKAGLIT